MNFEELRIKELANKLARPKKNGSANLLAEA
jgi:hypothetical protein